MPENRAGAWTVAMQYLNNDSGRTPMSATLNYRGSHGASQLNFSVQELSDLRHVIDQTIKQAIREMPADRRLEI